MKPPTTYAEWASALDAFARADAGALEALEDGRAAWIVGVAERLTVRVGHAFSARLSLALDRLKRDVGAGRTPHDIGAALLGVGRHVEALQRFARLPALPEDIRAPLSDALREAVETIEADLLRSARSSGAVALEAAVREARLRARLREPAATPVAVEGRAGRRVIL